MADMTMRLLRYNASKDTLPAWSIKLHRCYHAGFNGVQVQRGMRCYDWFWRLCK